MLSLRPPTDERLQRILDDEKAVPFPYPSPGATATGEFPPGFSYDHVETDLGSGSDERFGRARTSLMAWGPQRGVGIRVYPGDPVAADLAFVLAIPLPLTGWAIASGRVVYVVDESDRCGFAYGTLPSHPERGEEAFVVSRIDGRLRFEVTAFSRIHDPLARLGGPVARAFQVRTIRAYLGCMEAATAG
jgi:uncharacterized protein (UPF0548 family)